MWVETGKDTRKGRGTELSQIWKSMSSLFWSIFLRGPYLSLHKPQFFFTVSHDKLCNQNSFPPYFINRSDMDYLLAHTRYTATQIQEFYRCQIKLRLSLLVLWFTILKILPIDFINISPTKSKLKWIPRSLSPWSSGPWDRLRNVRHAT